MKKQSIPLKAKQLKKMYERGTLTFNNPIQRRSGQFTIYQKSLLMHSMMADIIVPPLFFIKEDRGSVDERGRKVSDFDVIDGQQRLIETFSFMDDGYKLDENTPPVEVDGWEIEVAGKLFSELDEDLQENISNFVFSIYNLEGNSDEEIEELFLRINGGNALSKSQNTKGRIGIKMMRYLNPFLESNFFSNVCNFSGAQYKTEVDFCTMLQCILMLDVTSGKYNLVSLSENDTMNYGSSIHDGINDETKIRFENIMEYLEKAFPDAKKEKWLRKTHIPVVFLVAEHAMEKDVDPDSFHEWFNEFAYSYYNPECKYAEYCGAGSVKKPKVFGRIEVMKNHFDEYFESYEVDDDMQDDQEEQNSENQEPQESQEQQTEDPAEDSECEEQQSDESQNEEFKNGEE